MLRSMPPATLAIIALCSSVYICQMVLDLDLHHYTMNPRMIVHLNEYYRFITSCLFHGSLMHLGMNMMSTAAISSMVEKRMGTLQHVFTILWAMLLTSSVYTIVAILLHIVLGMDGLMYQHSVGFSGVIFHLSILECNMAPHRSRSVFGFFTVPAYLYPWALLVALQVFMPNLSLLGHLAGILTGTLQLFGVLDVILVSDAYLEEMEKWNGLRFLTCQPNFVPTPPVSLETAPQRDPAASFRRALKNGVQVLGTFLRNVFETLLVCIFGRGRDANDNIQLGWPLQTPTGMTVDAVSEFEEEDDWVGLPPLSGSSVLDSGSRIV